MKTKEKITLSVTICIVLFSFLVIPVMTEVSFVMAKYPTRDMVPISDMFFILFYTHAVTYFDQIYLAGWYAGYSLYLPNLSVQLAQYLEESTQTSFGFIFLGPVFGYLEAPPWEAVYVIPAMYLPLLLIFPSWFLTKSIPAWRRIIYTYVIVTQVSVIARLVLVFIL